MKKVLVLLGAAIAMVAVVAPAGAAKPSDETKAAKKLCVQEKKADKAAFKATYGKNAMRNCKRQARDTVEEEFKNAAKECRAAQEADPEGFQSTYGENKNGKNAFGKCVSQTAKAELQEEVTEFKNAAKECRAERNADPDAFKETYGNNKNKKNAFGKCVSSKVSDDSAAEDEEEEEEETTTTS